MRNLNYQAVLNRVYRHFVIDRQPPGIMSGHIHYHQTDDSGADHPCAIGLFDTKAFLDDSILEDQRCPDLDDLYREYPNLLAEVFGVDALSGDDVRFLAFIQHWHDDCALRYGKHSKRDEPGAAERFAHDMANALEVVSKCYDLNALAF